MSDNVELRVVVQNTSDAGGTFLTPFYFGFTDEKFDLFDVGGEASAGLESLAEDGAFATLAAERLAVDADSQALVVTGDAGPIVAGEFTESTIMVDATSNNFVSFAAMILPSNDAFIGTDDAIQLFNSQGQFLGEQTIVFEGTDVYDAGTEVNTELDAAFINQAAPNTGEDENGVIRQHEGFNGSLGNPEGEGDQIILGGTNAFGVEIDPVAADFTQPDAQIAEVHINTVARHEGTDGRDRITGGNDDDLVNAGDGDDRINTGNGWDVVDAGAGDDRITAGRGTDIVIGGEGDDDVRLGEGDDYFVFRSGDGDDLLRDFNGPGDDTIHLIIEGVDSFEDVAAAAQDSRGGTLLDFGDAGSIFLQGVDADSLTSDDFFFG